MDAKVGKLLDSAEKRVTDGVNEIDGTVKRASATTDRLLNTSNGLQSLQELHRQIATTQTSKFVVLRERETLRRR